MPLESSRLTSRLRDVLRNGRQAPGTRDEVRPLEERDLPAEPLVGPRYVTDPDAASAWSAPTGCAVIERHYGVDVWHGRDAVHRYADTLDRCLHTLQILGSAAPASLPRRVGTEFEWDDDVRGGRARTVRDAAPVAAKVPEAGPLLFFDLETTGLSGGAGTVAFLVGCGFFDEEGFHTRQLFLSGYEGERDLLQSLAALVPRFGGVVTFNGRTFDIPLIETRYLFHRCESPFDGMPHFDMLHPARRLWRRRNSRFGEPSTPVSATSGENESCRLTALEEAILGVRREGDVPGFEIPSRYFHYLRTGDGSGLEAVFEHNRLDLLSLAAITAMAMQMVDRGPDATGTPYEALALGQVFERAGRGDEATACYGRAAGLGDAPWEIRSIEAGLRAEALRTLALVHRRHHRFVEAAAAWRQVLEVDGAHPYRREATTALAVHHEHRARDLATARTYAERALGAERDPAEADALRHRLSRLDRKIGKHVDPGSGVAGPDLAARTVSPPGRGFSAADDGTRVSAPRGRETPSVRLRPSKTDKEHR